MITAYRRKAKQKLTTHCRRGEINCKLRWGGNEMNNEEVQDIRDSDTREGWAETSTVPAWRRFRGSAG